MTELLVCTLLWEPNVRSREFSRCYSEEWVEKLYRGFKRHLARPFTFLCYTDRPRIFAEPIEQERIRERRPDYSTCIRPYELGRPMILVGLDTVITGDVGHLADYCMTAEVFALPRDPYHPGIACNGVALVPAGHESIGLLHSGENDMEWVRRFEHRFIDDLFPGHVESYKGSVRANGLRDVRIVYLHGRPKMHELAGEPWVQEHWI